MLCVGLLLAVPAGIFAQKTTTKPTKQANSAAAKPVQQDTAVANLFAANTPLKWTRYFRGRLDDATEILLSMGSDGANCRGWMVYSKSQERFQLSGTLEGVVLILEERDSKNNVTGHLVGSLQGEQLEADWTNAANTLGSRVEAKEVPSPRPVNLPCGDNKWVRRYIARWNNGRVDMILERVNNNVLNGYLWIETDDRTYTLTGKYSPDDHYEIQALLPNGKTAAHLQGSMKIASASDCLWVGSGEKRNLKLTMRESLQVGCLEYADYTSSYDVLYPRTRCENCNKALDKRVDDWVTQCKNTMAAQKKAPIPANRNTLRASAWYDVTCWTETIFCGYLTFAETWKDKPDGVSFNFDLRSGREITYDDLFNKGFNATEWFADYARKEMPKMAKFAADPKFREWVAAEGFPMFTIRRDGLELSTLFHPVYGQHHLTVPYANLKPYMRRDNPIADLVK